MQTIKTAAIVVLLMTVMYGAYVSLTTPPEPLPNEVHQMLVESDEFDIDAGFPESLDSLGSPMDSGDDAFADAGASDEEEAAAGAAGDPAVAGEATRQSLSGVSGSLSDQDNLSSDDEATAFPAPPTDPPDGDRLASRDAMALPDVEGAATSVSIDRDRQYPSTGGEFDLPDPQQAAEEGDFQGDPSASFDEGISGDSDSDAGNGDSSADSGDGDSGGDSGSRSGRGLANAIRVADEQYHAGKKKEALATLSLFYDTPELTAEQRSELLSRLDPLAREVIYSRSHLLEQPHRVLQNETLIEIAAEYEVPWQLLANINGIDDPITVLPGTDLKIVRGPFRADVSLGEQELTLFVGDYYAGRFPIGIGEDPSPEPGSYTVQDKQGAKTYYDASGSPVPPESPDNPYGSMWLDLGSQLCVHGSPSPSEPTDKGCISLAGDHASDLQGILSQGSAVVIRR